MKQLKSKSKKELADILIELKKAKPDYDSNDEQKAIAMCKKVIEFYKSHNRPLSGLSRNEKKLSAWLASMKSAKQGTSKSKVWYPILEQMTIDAGFPAMFDIIDKGIELNKKLTTVFDWIDINNKYPTINKYDNIENRHASFLSNLRHGVLSTGTCRLYDISTQHIRN